ATNLTSFVVYLRLRLKDSMSVCFFLLSCSDLVSVSLMLPADFLFLFSTSLPQSWRVDGESLTTLLMFYYPLFYDISQLITTFIAVQRCWCVALPFRFKSTFTRRRVAEIVLALVFLCVCQYVPVMASQGLQETRDPARNTTVFVFWTSNVRGTVMSARGTTALVITTTCQSLVTACLAILASTLRASANFRRTVAMAPKEMLSPELSTQDGSTVSSITTAWEASKHAFNRQSINKMKTNRRNIFTEPTHILNPRRNTSRKEVQAVKATTLVSVIFVLCNTPRLLMYYTSLCVPDFNMQRRYENSYVVGNSFRFFFEAMNASFNVFVYVKFNKRFRSAVMTCAR
ncbi:unnamed protein product, partial [Lymnaea stagnalis]